MEAGWEKNIAERMLTNETRVHIHMLVVRVVIEEIECAKNKLSTVIFDCMALILSSDNR